MRSGYVDMTDSERQVARYLTELDLWWVFESPIFVYDDRDRPRVWTPDFYVPKLGMYIEVCGSERFGESGFRFRDEIYRKNGWLFRDFCPCLQGREKVEELFDQ